MAIPVSAPQNVWFDTRNVDDADLTLEQNYNNLIQSGIKSNHFGSGVLPGALTQHIIFDSNAANGLLDGKVLLPQSQPTDSNSGNQFAVELTGSEAAGRRTVKVLIIGLDFQNNLQYDTYVFNVNEIQIGSKHFRTVLAILFNDFVGTSNQSFNLGGRIIISEATPLSLSRDTIMIAQDVQPNLFFRDFFVSTGGSIGNVLTAALPSYNIDTLNITTGYKQLRSLLQNDVSSQIGQKFLTTTNNIQKVTLLLSVLDNVTPTNIVWTGNILVSIYALQTSLTCPTDVVPELTIDFDPSNIPLAQLSVTYNDLLNAGVQLNSVPQPVDFVFSNTPVGSGLLISANSYYVVTIKRAGSADTAQIQVAVGSNTASNTRETLFNGSVWTDVPEESLWFQVWTDAAKVSDGQAYDAGNGIFVPKTQIDPNTALTVDYVLNQIPFVRNDLYYALVQAVTQESVPLQDERTGNPIDSQQQFIPSVTLLNTTALANIQNVSVPLIVGTISDENVKSFGTNTSVPGAMHEYGMVENQVVMKVITSPTDGYDGYILYDGYIISLVSELVNGTLNGAKFTPNVANPNFFYKIAKAELITMIYGDVDGNGIIDNNDLLAAQQLIGTNLNIFPSEPQYIDNITPFANDVFLTWQIINPVGPTVVASGTDGIITVNPNNTAQANFNSGSASFGSIMNLGNFAITISGSMSSAGNNGSFAIVNLVDNHDITIQKVLYTSDTILQIMRTDIDGDMVVDAEDINFITNYINVVPPFPAPTSPANRVGTTFQAIRLTLEQYVDRNDEYPSNAVNRPTVVHPLPDLFLDGYSFFAGRDVAANPISFRIDKQLIWDPSSVVVNSNPRLVPAAFNYQSGYVLNSCSIQGVVSQTFPETPNFDPGRNDFFIPNNLIINNGGELFRPDGYFYKVDFEQSTILFEIPDGYFDTEKVVNLFSDFVANFTGTGYTRIGYPAMRFADCSLVGLDALDNNQVRFGVAVQSFSPQLDGLDPMCINGVVVDGKIGVSMDYGTGLLTLNFTNLYQDPVKQTLNTKVEITVYLKKAGWNNTPIFVGSDKAANVLGLITPPPILTNCLPPPMVVMSFSSPVSLGSNFTISVTVISSDPSMTPTGVIEYRSNAITLGVSALAMSIPGTATTSFSASSTPLGTGLHNIVAFYAGDSNFPAAASVAEIIDVV